MGSNMKNKRVLYNIFTNLCVQVIVALSGFVIPRFVMSIYGSAMNGMINSISQFLTYAALVEMGVGNASIAALYKPIAEKNIVDINSILKQSKQKYFVSGIAYAIIAGMIAFLYPHAVNTQIRYDMAFTMALILSISGLIDYFIIGKYKVLLIADEKTYILNIFKGMATIILTILSVALLLEGFSIYAVKFTTVLIHLAEAFLIKFYVKSKYSYVTFYSKKEVKLEQQSSALVHQICATIVYNTDLIILTIFMDSETSLMEISVYSVYIMVRNMITYLGKVLTDGINATFGLMFAKADSPAIKRTFSQYEYIYYIYIFVLYSCMAGLILSFVNCYTKNVNDVEYLHREYAILFSMEGFLAQLKSPSDVIINAAGHYKQSRKYVWMEAVINLSLSIFLVKSFGIAGVLSGTIVSHIFIDVCFMSYVAQKLIPDTGYVTVRRVVRNVAIAGILWWVEIYKTPLVSKWGQWILEVFIVFIINISIIVLINFLLEKEMARKTFEILLKK